MIVESQYPTRFEIPTVGISSSDAKLVECTDNFGSTYQGQTVDSVDSYFLGYISAADMPRAYGATAVYKDDDGNIIFEEITSSGNFPCGYCFCFSDYYEVNKTMYTIINGTKTIPGNLQVRLYNNNYPMYSGRATWTNMSSYLALQFAWVLFDGEGTALGNQISSYTYSFINTKESYDFLKGNKKLTLNLGTYSGTTISVKIDAENIAEGKAYLPVEGTNYSVRIVIIGFDNNNGVYAISYTSPPAVYPRFMVKVNGAFADTNIERVSCGSSPNGTAYSWFTKNHIDSASPTKDSPLFMYNIAMSGKFDERGFQNISNSKFYFDGNMCFMVTNNGIDAYPIFSIEEILKAFCLSYRGDTTINGHTAGYVKDVTYATDVNSNNRFLARWKTGNLEDAAFKNGLREWQWDDSEDGGFKTDDFKEEDVPPEPGEDDPGDEPEDMEDAYGDDVTNLPERLMSAPSLFITQYALTISQLRTVGLNLWSSWLDVNSEVWKNFLFDYFQDTGTFNITSALDFIISLRVFPFNIPDIGIDALTGTTGVYMGTGHTNFCPENVLTVNSIIGCIYAGEVNVEAKIPYNDFRDIYNCSVSVFLPYCGTVELNPAEVIGKTLKAYYFIDFQSGSCTAVVEVNNDGKTYNIASKSGQIGFLLPVTATNAGQLSAQFASDTTRAIGTLGGFFFDVAKSIGSSAESLAKVLAFNKTPAGEKNPKEEPLGMTVTQSIGIGESGFNTALGLANQGIDMLSRSAIDMPMLSGGSGAEAMMQPAGAYVQIRRGKYAKPNNYPHSVGHFNLSSNPISYYKGTFKGNPATGSNTGKGFCVFTGIDSTGLNCREDEKTEILALLESGVYL